MFKAIFGALGLLVGIPAGAVLSFFVADWLRINWYHGGSLLWWPCLLSVAVSTSIGVFLGAVTDAWRRRRRK